MGKKGYHYEERQEKELKCKVCGHKSTFICFADEFPDSDFKCTRCGRSL